MDEIYVASRAMRRNFTLFNGITDSKVWLWQR